MGHSSAPLRSSSSPPSGRVGTLNGATCSPHGSRFNFKQLHGIWLGSPWGASLAVMSSVVLSTVTGEGGGASCVVSAPPAHPLYIFGLHKKNWAEARVVQDKSTRCYRILVVTVL